MLYTLPVVWLVVSLVFLMIHLVPGDPILQMLGEGAPAADVQAARHAYGLDEPAREAVFALLERRCCTAISGSPLRLNQSVSKLVLSAIRTPLQLTLAALFVAVLLSIPAGVRSAQRRNHWDDRTL